MECSLGKASLKAASAADMRSTKCFVCFVLFCFGVSPSAASDSTLELVFAFFRHGSRTPQFKETYPNDPYKTKDFEPMGWGQLTNVGKERAYNLGLQLRKRYDTFLGDIHTPDIVLATSTDFDRTKMTASLVLAGLFPPAPSQRWSPHLNWNPIPYHFDKNDRDYTLRRPNHYCPTYIRELRKVENGESTLSFLKENQKLLEYMTTHSGKPIRNTQDAFDLYQTLLAEDKMNLTLPEWTASVYPSALHDLSAKQCQLENYNALMKRLNGGRMLGKVIEHMKEKIEGTMVAARKMHLYSAHETNVLNVLAALDLFQPHMPKYCAATIFELHKLRKEDEESYAVKVFYKRELFQEPEDLTVPGCENPCPFEKFLDITGERVPHNFTEECGSHVYLD